MTSMMLPPKQVRQAIRRARVVYFQADVGVIRVSKAEALRVIRPDHYARSLRVQTFRDSVCVAADVDD
jgi:hypothetical protein